MVGKTRGGFYSEVPMIALTTHPDRVEDSLCHEVVHSTLHCVGARLPIAVEEGLAMRISESITENLPAGAKCWDAYYSHIGPQLERAIRDGKIPSLRQFMSMSEEAFLDDSTALNYHLALCLASVLVDDADPEISGKLREFIPAVSGDEDVWIAFCRTYPEERIAAKWRLAIERTAIDR
jgi:hypothetical protein